MCLTLVSRACDYCWVSHRCWIHMTSLVRREGSPAGFKKCSSCRCFCLFPTCVAKSESTVIFKMKTVTVPTNHLCLSWVLVQLEERPENGQWLEFWKLLYQFIFKIMIVTMTKIIIITKMELKIVMSVMLNLLQSLSNLKQSPSFLPASSAPMYSDIFFW